MSMDNRTNHDPGDVPDAFCEKCGYPIEDLQIMAPGTEYEYEVMLCEKCFGEAIANASGEVAII